MNGKVVVITGGTSGIGQVAAEALAAQGARVVLVARDKARGEATLKRLKPGQAHSLYIADLASIGATRALAAQIAAAEPRIDVLINNAGALFNSRRLSPDGLELTFALNHMAYFVLTEGLLDRLKATPGARVVSTASRAHQGSRLDFEDLQAAKSYSGFEVYGRSKLANILFTRELARRLAGSGVVANCLHPGFVATRFGDQSGGMLQRLMPLAKLMAVTPKAGADTIIHLASSPEVESQTGLYFYKRMPVAPSAEAQDDAAAARLWAESERLAAQAG
ncbi:SDR family NAD(P)-dependent oxidoreductase [Phenylobacterium montanum]|uniref:SDR family NAD(P)-dependent oxidoreductase n=1 Tax=Phenylobacterium montanum TaxID=2823693 RepID=A0A975IVJ5_9CAUL|nr:SDR family NAD(P)-dependent oxidoreductase [Caulobacter sp. S6]QUD87391.1 SDR family NAD(P)-dependent oxidoreductase [Caulobacter sp. S6]